MAPPIRWGRWITVLLILLVAAYLTWPLVGFYRIGSAVESKNAAALAQRVEFPSLRRSLSQQVIAEYLKLTGKDEKLGRFRTGVATGVGAALAASYRSISQRRNLAGFSKQGFCQRWSQNLQRRCSLLRLFMAQCMGSVVAFGIRDNALSRLPATRQTEE